MKTETALALALGGIALWMLFAPRKAAGASATSGSSTFSSLMHPADAYAGSWTANGPFVPAAYDKQIWD